MFQYHVGFRCWAYQLMGSLQGRTDDLLGLAVIVRCPVHLFINILCYLTHEGIIISLFAISVCKFSVDVSGTGGC